MMVVLMDLQLKKKSEGVGNMSKKMGSMQKKLKARQYKRGSCKSTRRLQVAYRFHARFEVLTGQLLGIWSYGM